MLTLTDSHTPRPGLTRARIQRRLSQADLAEQAGIHRVQIAEYERGTQTPNVDIGLRIAAILRIRPDQLWQVGDRITTTEVYHLEGRHEGRPAKSCRLCAAEAAHSSSTPGTEAGRARPEETKPRDTEEAS